MAGAAGCPEPPGLWGGLLYPGTAAFPAALPPALPAASLRCRVCAGTSLPNWFSSSVGRVRLFRKAPKYMLFAKLSCINKYQHFSPDLCSFAGFLLNAEHTKPPFIPGAARITLSPRLWCRGTSGNCCLHPPPSQQPRTWGSWETQKHLGFSCLELRGQRRDGKAVPSMPAFTNPT